MGKNVSALEQIGFRPTNSNELWLTTEVLLYIREVVCMLKTIYARKMHCY